MPGTLYVVATPIGNMADITLRALEVLKQVDLVAAEDTRHTAKLLRFYDIRKPTASFHEHNERSRTRNLIRRLKNGLSIALTSNAGTPTISDPGYRLVHAARENGIRVVPVPGPCALIAALSASGLPTDAFSFMGFLDRKKQKRLNQIEKIKTEPRTVILYESPRRILSLLEELVHALGEGRCAVLSREMTKVHEEFIRGRLGDVVRAVKEQEDLKGECVLLISGAGQAPASRTELQKEIQNALASSALKPAILSRMIADKLGLPKSRVYEEMIKLKNEAPAVHSKSADKKEASP